MPQLCSGGSRGTFKASAFLFTLMLLLVCAAGEARAALTVTLSADLTSPQPVNTSIEFTAAASGGTGPYEYRFFLQPPGGSYGEVQAYSTDNTWLWTPTATGKYYVRVYARTVGFPGSYQGTYSRSYVIGLGLSVARAGSGTGTVTSSPAGIACGGTCSAAFTEGTVVTLAATAAAGSVFSGWSGACAGGATCKVTMSATRSVTAYFTATAAVTWHVVGGVKETCVDSASALATALGQASWDGYTNRIKVVQGLYRGPFVYGANEDFGLELLGGYTAGCEGRGFDPGRTALSGDIDADGAGDVVTLDLDTIKTGGTGSFLVERLQIQEGRNDVDSGGCLRAYAVSGSITLRGNVVAACSSVYGAGIGAETLSGDLLLQNNVVFRNTASIGGGGVGVATASGQITLINNTISGNTAGATGGGIGIVMNGDSAAADLENNIVWRNAGTTCAEVDIESDGDGNSTHAPALFDYNDAVLDGVCGSDPAFTPGLHNVNDIDPQFLDAANGWYAISPTSPVINLGNPTHPLLPAIDFMGEPRNYDGGVDLGADEVVTGVATVTLVSNPASPQVANTTITFEASATGGGAAEYQFWLQDPSGAWTSVQGYDTSKTWAWTPAVEGSYVIRVYARSAGSTKSYEATYTMGFTVIPPIPPRVTSVTLNASPPSPQAINTEITFEAAASGGSGDYEYRFWLWDDTGGWVSVQGYEPSNTWTWTPDTPGSYRIMVYARSVGRPYSYDATYNRTFVITP